MKSKENKICTRYVTTYDLFTSDICLYVGGTSMFTRITTQVIRMVAHAAACYTSLVGHTWISPLSERHSILRSHSPHWPKREIDSLSACPSRNALVFNLRTTQCTCLICRYNPVPGPLTHWQLLDGDHQALSAAFSNACLGRSLSWKRADWVKLQLQAQDD